MSTTSPFVTCISGLSSEMNLRLVYSKMWYSYIILLVTVSHEDISIYLYSFPTSNPWFPGFPMFPLWFLLISEVSTSQQRSTSSRCCRPWDGDDLLWIFCMIRWWSQGNIWKCTRVLMVFFFFQLCMSHQLYYRFYHCDFILSLQKWKYWKFNKFQIGNN